MNPIIEKTKQAVLSNVDTRLQPVIQKLVEAGKKIMYSDQTRQMVMDQMKQGTDPESIGAGVAKLGGLLFVESKRTAPFEALSPAMVLLLMEVLGFLEEAGAVQVTPEFVAQCTQALGSAVLQMVGATPEKLQSMLGDSAAAGQSAQQPPMAKRPTSQAAGLVAGAMGG